MAKISLSILFSLLLLLPILCSARRTDSVVHRRSWARAFVETQCKATLYPRLCVQCLSGYANITAQSTQQLAHAALLVSLARAQYTRAYVNKVVKELRWTKARDYQVLKDCLDQVDDGVGQLAQSVKELRRMSVDGEGEFGWHQSNVETWLSAALTDATTCIDGFSGQAVGGKVRAIIKAKVLNVAQVTSNALALFSRFAARHRAAGAGKP